MCTTPVVEANPIPVRITDKVKEILLEAINIPLQLESPKKVERGKANKNEKYLGLLTDAS